MKALAFLLVGAATSAMAQGAPPAGSSTPFVVEYYYTARWGFADEFIRLFKKNHYPVLQRQKELGNILEIRAEAPRFPDSALRRLFPDQETFRREEQRRFEILLAHWDLPIVKVDLTAP